MRRGRTGRRAGTWSEWRWSEFTGGQSAQAIFQETYDDIPADDEFWDTPAGDPGEPANLFGDASYTRGAMTLQALRAKVGEAAFTRIMRAWYAENRDGNVVTADFVALSERESGQQLDAFFDVWLYEPGKPTSWYQKGPWPTIRSSTCARSRTRRRSSGCPLGWRPASRARRSGSRSPA